MRDEPLTSIIAACENRIAGLERDKHVLVEKGADTDKPGRGFEELFELSMKFLANPRKLRQD